MENWNNKWKKILLWVVSYLNILGFVLVGGYFILKGDNDLKKESKKCFITMLPFIAIDALIDMITYFISINGSVSGASNISTFSSIIGIIKIVTFVVMIVLVILEKNSNSLEKTDSNNDDIKG